MGKKIDSITRRIELLNIAIGEITALFMSQEKKGTEIEMPTEELIRISDDVKQFIRQSIEKAMNEVMDEVVDIDLDKHICAFNDGELDCYKKALRDIKQRIKEYFKE